jgi:hypothetical protein
VTARAWQVGDTVWYAPSLGGPCFRAVVASQPLPLGSSRVVRLIDLPKDYAEYTKRDRRHVPAAECDCHLFNRDTRDIRSQVTWIEAGGSPVRMLPRKSMLREGGANG